MRDINYILSKFLPRPSIKYFHKAILVILFIFDPSPLETANVFYEQPLINFQTLDLYTLFHFTDSVQGLFEIIKKYFLLKVNSI